METRIKKERSADTGSGQAQASRVTSMREAKLFLRALFGGLGVIIDIRLLGEGKAPRRIACRGVKDAINQVRLGAAQKLNVLAGVASRYRQNDPGTKWNLGSTRALFIDCDFENDDERDLLKRRLDAFPMRPSIRIASGNGEHVYWLLEKPVELGNELEVERFESVLKGLADNFDADSNATDATRVMRVPGTINYPDRVKRRKGRTSRRCRLLAMDAEAKYAFEDFADHEWRGDLLRRDAEEVVPYDGAGSSEEVPADIKDLLEADPRLRQRWRGDATGLSDQSDSGVDWALAGLLADRLLPELGRDRTGAMIERVLRERRELAGARSKDAQYFRRTAGKALGSAGGQVVGAPAPSSPEAEPIEVISKPPARHGQQWPDPVGEAALHGLAGEFVRFVEPHTEADPVGLLLQFHVMYGSVIGRSAHFVAEQDRHYSNLFTVLVGETAKGRKGSSFGQVRAPFAQVDGVFVTGSVASGLSSGEGLMHAVRDPEPDDEEIMDKRLLVFESEFASVLRVIEREGNTLSSVCRQAWDRGTLRVLTKKNATTATDVHISIIGHITSDELLRYLRHTEIGNGFANRILWAGVRRSKLLPEGGRLREEEWAPLVRALRKAVEFGRATGEMVRDDGARALWREVYAQLSEGRPGMMGAMVSRAEAQTMRLAMVYALLDRSPAISKAHLAAALELERYCEDSVSYVFGDHLGDPDADSILEALEQAPGGMTRTELSGLLGRHRTAAQLDRALNRLSELGKAHCERERTGGRSSERWHASGTRMKRKKRSNKRKDS